MRHSPTNASAQVWGNTVGGNGTRPRNGGRRLLVIDATVNMTKQNATTNNLNAILNEGGSIVNKKVSA